MQVVVIWLSRFPLEDEMGSKQDLGSNICPLNTQKPLMTDIAERDGDRGEQIINYASMH
jgi:hypothetical protein